MNGTRAVILAGSPGTAHFPFANYFPKLGLPVANEPLIHHLAHHLHIAGITEIGISVSNHLSLYRAFAKKINRHPDLGVHVRIFKEDEPMGSAGALNNMRDFVKGSTVLVLSSSAFISGQDLLGVIKEHRSHETGLTAVMVQCNGSNCANLENYRLDSERVIQEFTVIHRSRNRRKSDRCLPGQPQERRTCMCGAGIFVLSPQAIARIPNSPGYMDINEQLIPALHESGIPARAMVVEGPLPKIVGLNQYFQTNRRILMQPGEDQEFVFRNSTQIADGVWVGDGVKIAKSARLVGPVLIGSRSHISEDTMILGPVAIGAGSHIEAGARVENSFLGIASRVGKGASLRKSLVANRGVVRRGENLRRSVIVNAKDLEGGLSLVPIKQDDGFRVVLRHGRFVPTVQARRRWFKGMKRAVDVTAAASMLVVLSPVFAVIAAAIKWGGDGPVFYSQRRCGRDGHEFRMHKFRTMVVDAHEMQQKLAENKDVDGPMFKLENDPRVTRIGRFLRDTSLDELPQLINVLKAEMSLVGPRPLIMEEMNFAPNWRDIRLQVTPGITGLWQVNGRHKVSFHDWIKNDIRYVKEQSLGLDAKILLSTFRVLGNGRRL